MRRYGAALFDLDGTVIDSGLGITNSVMYALRRCGRPVPERSELYSFVGPPLYDSFERYCGFSKEDAREAVRLYREYYREKGIFEFDVYDGIPELLRTLHGSGLTLILATSKPEKFAEKIMAHIGVAEYFDVIAGSCFDGTRIDKHEVIEYALGRCGIADRAAAVMAGDRDSDIFGARRSGMDSIGVLYGYGSREELEAARPEYLAEKPCDIGKIILGENYGEIMK